MKVLRTPDARFENLDGFPYQPNHREIDDGRGGRLRMHYVDEGPKDAPVILWRAWASRSGLIPFEK